MTPVRKQPPTTTGEVPEGSSLLVAKNQIVRIPYKEFAKLTGENNANVSTLEKTIQLQAAPSMGYPWYFLRLVEIVTFLWAVQPGITENPTVRVGLSVLVDGYPIFSVEKEIICGIVPVSFVEPKLATVCVADAAFTEAFENPVPFEAGHGLSLKATLKTNMNILTNQMAFGRKFKIVEGKFLEFDVVEPGVIEYRF